MEEVEAPEASDEEVVVEESAAITGLRKSRVSDKTRKAYATGTTQLLIYLWTKKPSVLPNSFKLQFAVDDVIPATAPLSAAIRATLPGFRADKGMGPDPLKWDEFTAADFMEWMVELQNLGGLKKGNMRMKRSALYNLYMDFKQGKVYDSKLKQELSQLGRGLARQLTQAVRDEGGEVREGKMPLSIELYRTLAMCFLTDAIASNGHCDGAFGHLFFVLMWNLMYRASNCDHILLEHMEWRNDACVIHFAQQKTDQGGDLARYGRHVFANPRAPEICVMLSLGIYWLSFPGNLVKDKRLFPGRDQYSRFSKTLGRFAKDTSNIEKFRKHGIKPEEIGAHSARKGSSTYASSGTTACPTTAAVSIRAGWKQVGVEGTYKRYDAAGDQHVGRTVAGLDVTTPDFMLMPPFFRRYNDDGTPVVGVEAFIHACITAGFGDDVPHKLFPLVEHALASVVYHWEFVCAKLPPNHRLFGNPLLRDVTNRQQLQSLVICVLGNSPAVQREGRSVTGIPPHVTLMASFQTESAKTTGAVTRLEARVQDLPAQMEESMRRMVDDGAVKAGEITPQILTRTITQCLSNSGLTEVVEGIKNGTLTQGVASTTPGANTGGGHQGGVGGGQQVGYKRPSADWVFPPFSAETAFRAWAAGMGDGIGPYSGLKIDMIPQTQKRNFKNFKRLMSIVTKKIVEQVDADWNTDSNVYTDARAKEVYDQVRDDIEIEGNKHKRRHTQLLWTTVLKNFETKRAKTNASNRAALEEQGNEE